MFPLSQQDRSSKHTEDHEFQISRLKNVICYPHIHHWMEILFISEGQLEFKLENENYLLSENEAIYISPYETHEFIGGNHECYILEMPFQTLPLLYDNMRFQKISERRIHLTENASAYLRSILPSERKDRSNSSLHDKGVFLAALSLLCESFLKIAEPVPVCSPEQTLFHSALELLQQIIENTPTEDLTLISVARLLNVHPVTLSKTFSKSCPISFNKYVQYLRVHQSIRLLKKGYSITTAAVESGFNSIRSYNRVFHNLTGYSPTEMLKNPRDNEYLLYTWNLVQQHKEKN